MPGKPPNHRQTDRPPSEIQWQPRAKIWLEVDGEYAFGSGMSKILKAVAQEGSIKAAAASLGKSYRYIWARIKSAEKSLGEQLVETQVGGQGAKRSALTDRGQRLTAHYDALRQRVLEVLEEEFEPPSAS